jgi:hypothetical protein
MLHLLEQKPEFQFLFGQLFLSAADLQAGSDKWL